MNLAYRFFAQTVLLLMAYAAAALLAAAKFLPDDPLALSLPYHHIGALMQMLLHLAIFTGLLGGGLYVAEPHPQPVRSLPLAGQSNLERGFGARLTYFAAWGWTLLLVAALFAGMLGLFEGRHGLELPPLLDLAQMVLMAVIVGGVVVSSRDRSPVLLVWTAGMGIALVGLLIGLWPVQTYAQDWTLRALAVGLQDAIGALLAAFALAYWLAYRFSTISEAWGDSSLLTVAGLVALMGTLLTLASLQPLQPITPLIALAVPLLVLIVAAHGYRPLRDRSPSATLAAHWYAFGLILLLLGPGLLGGLQALPAIHQWTLGTRLTDLQMTLTQWIPVVLTLGVINQAVAEMHGQNGRITGLMPFWLVSFGVIGGGLALAGAGIAQVYMERVLSVGYLETQTLLTPLYALWVGGLLCVALGVLLYALGFWARRPVQEA